MSRTLLELVHDRTGSISKSAHVVTFVLAWAKTADRLGREPTIEEYAMDWKQPRTSAYREQRRFREAFPEYETPAPLLEAAVDGSGVAA